MIQATKYKTETFTFVAQLRDSLLKLLSCFQAVMNVQLTLRTSTSSRKSKSWKRENTILNNLLCIFFQLCAELKQVQTKLAHVEQDVNTQGSECERQQQKIRDLELELARTSTNCTTTTNLQGELQAERTRLIAADRKVSATYDPSASTLSSFYFTCWTSRQQK